MIYLYCFLPVFPLRVCAIVIPWNYPLMMLAWKTAACLAAGNTVVLKPAQVSLLTGTDEMKIAEQSAVIKKKTGLRVSCNAAM